MGRAGGLPEEGLARAAPMKLEHSAPISSVEHKQICTSFMGRCLRAGRASPARGGDKKLGGGGGLLRGNEDLKQTLRNQVPTNLKGDGVHAGFGQENALHFQGKVRDA